MTDPKATPTPQAQAGECSRCGAATPEMAALICSPDGDDCPGVRLFTPHLTPPSPARDAGAVACPYWVAEQGPQDATHAYVLGRDQQLADEYRAHGWRVRPLIYGDTHPAAQVDLLPERALLAGKIQDDEPCVTKDATYFWRCGWNAYRDALKERAALSSPDGLRKGEG